MGILDDIRERKAALAIRGPALSGVIERKTEIAQGAMRIGVQDRPRYPDVSPESLAKAHRRNELVYACVGAKADAMADPRFVVEERQADGTYQEVAGHPLTMLMMRPNDLMDGAAFLRALVVSKDIFGKFVCENLTSGAGLLVGLNPLNPAKIAPKAEADNQGRQTLAGYVWRDGGSSQTFRTNELTIYAPPEWVSPPAAEVGLGSVDGDNAQTDYVRAFFNNAGVPSGILKVKGTYTQEKTDQLKGKWRANYGRITGSQHELAVLDDNADYQQIGAKLNELSADTLRMVSESRICMVFKVPPLIVYAYVGLLRATYCLPANARVATPSGPKFMVDVSPGDVVWSYVDGRLQPRKVTWSGKTGTKRLYAVRTRNRILRATDNHPVLVRVPGSMTGPNQDRAPSVAWKPVGELRVGDVLVQPLNYPDMGGDTLPDGAQATTDLMQWLGAFVGDGSASDGVISIAMPPADRTRDHYAELSSLLFEKQTSSLKPNRRVRDGSTEAMVELRAGGETLAAIGERYGLAAASVRDRITTAVRTYEPTMAPVAPRTDGRAFRFRSKQTAAWLHQLGFVKPARQKRIPGWVFGLREDLRLAFLAGIVDSDGSVDRRGTLTFASASRQLVEDVKDLLLSVGIESSNLSYRRVPASALPQPGRQESYDLWSIVASAAVDIARIPFADPLYRERVNANPERKRPSGRDAIKAGLEGLGFFTISEIAPLEVEDVYDITVEDGHSFVADGVVVHNSNVKEAYKGFWDLTLLPLFKEITAWITLTLLPQFEPMERILSGQVRCRFDTSAVAALQDDEDRKQERARSNFRAGGITLNEYRAAIGQQADPAGDYYLRLLSYAPSPAGAAANTTADDVLAGKSRAALLPAPGQAQKAGPPRAVEDRLERALRTYLEDEYAAAAEAVREGRA